MQLTCNRPESVFEFVSDHVKPAQFIKLKSHETPMHALALVKLALSHLTALFNHSLSLFSTVPNGIQSLFLLGQWHSTSDQVPSGH